MIKKKVLKKHCKHKQEQNTSKRNNEPKKIKHEKTTDYSELDVDLQLR